MSEVKERGAAKVVIELSNGVITVRHGDSLTSVLAEWTANAGDWDKLWATIKELEAIGQA